MKHLKLNLVIALSILTLIGCASSKNKQNVAQTQQEQTYVNQAKTYLEYESSDSALTAIESAIALDKSNPNLYIIQAQAYVQQKNLSQAQNSYNKAIKLSPKNGLYLSSLTTAECTLDPTINLITINKNYDNALQLEQSNGADIAQIIADKGNCYVSRNLNNDAITLFESAITSNTPPLDAYTGITKAYIEEGNYPKAALMINSIPNNEQNRQVILLKIDALSGLLGKQYSIKDKNRKILINKIEQLQQQLQQQPPVISTSTVTFVDKPVITPPIAAPEVVSTPVITTAIVKPAVQPEVVTIKPPQSLPPQVQNKPVTTKTAMANVNTPFAKRVKTANGKKYIVIKHGDTLFSISKQSGISKEQIIKINNFKNDFVPLGCKVYLN